MPSLISTITGATGRLFPTHSSESGITSCSALKSLHQMDLSLEFLQKGHVFRQHYSPNFYSTLNTFCQGRISLCVVNSISYGELYETHLLTITCMACGFIYSRIKLVIDVYLYFLHLCDIMKIPKKRAKLVSINWRRGT